MFEIGIVGMGYLGSAMLEGFETLKTHHYKIKCMDTNPYKIGQSKLTKSFINSDIVFICIGTANGCTTEIEKTLIEISLLCEEIEHSERKLKYVIIKSTVPVGFCRKQNDRIKTFEILSNPEFLREGSACSDFIYPARIIIGKSCINEKIHVSILKFFDDYPSNMAHVLETTYENAELTKLANNTFLAMKLNFINTLAEFADTNEHLNIQIVSELLQYDRRIGKGYLKPGPGIGGSCLLKDTDILIKNIERTKSNSYFFASIYTFNIQHMVYILGRINELCKGKQIAILGLSFKARTEDMRNSYSITIIDFLQSKYTISVHDPIARIENNSVTQFDSPYAACKNADLVLVATEWKQYTTLNFKTIAEKMNGKIIYDLRNIIDKENVKNAGLTYYGMGIN